VLAILFVAIPLLAISMVLERLSLADAGGEPIGYPGLVAYLLLPFGAIALAVLAWVHFVERRSLATLGLAAGGGRGAYPRGIDGGVATSLSVVVAIFLAGGFIATGSAPAFRSATALLQIAALLACFVVQAGAEEILFRGWLLSALDRKANRFLAVCITCAVFAVLHYGPHQHWLMTLNMVLYSAFACCLAIDANHIWGVMGWHTGWNWMLATGFEMPVTGMDVHLPALVASMLPSGSILLTGGAEGPEGSMLCSLFFVLGIVFLCWRIAGRRPVFR
jgi:membrane protease YdiL (CAAX protease family)